MEEVGSTNKTFPFLQVMDFHIEFVMPADGKWGVIEANDSFNGIVGVLQRNRIQLWNFHVDSRLC
jgi:hypothetical protein